MVKQRFFKAIYILVVAIRIGSLAIFLIDPLIAWLIAFILDTSDYVFALRSGLTYRQYQNIDKSLDLLSRVYFVVSAFFFGWPHAWLFVALFLLRLIGDILYFKTRREVWFFFFPNVIEFFFPLYILILPAPSVESILLIFIVSLVVKLLHEHLTHIYRFIDPVSKTYIAKHPEHQRHQR